MRQLDTETYNNKPLTMVGMTDEDALAFVQFQKHYTFIKLLESIDAFNIKSGTLIVNFDNLGRIGSLEVTKHYRL